MCHTLYIKTDGLWSFCFGIIFIVSVTTPSPDEEELPYDSAEPIQYRITENQEYHFDIAVGAKETPLENLSEADINHEDLIITVDNFDSEQISSSEDADQTEAQTDATDTENDILTDITDTAEVKSDISLVKIRKVRSALDYSAIDFSKGNSSDVVGEYVNVTHNAGRIYSYGRNRPAAKTC